MTLLSTSRLKNVKPTKPKHLPRPLVVTQPPLVFPNPTLAGGLTRVASEPRR